MTVVGTFAPYSPAAGCSPCGPAGPQAFQTFCEDVWPYQYPLGICSCRPVNGGASWSHHAECRAYDQGIPTETGVNHGLPILSAVLPFGRNLGIDHVIYNLEPWRRDRGKPWIWTALYPAGKPYTGAHPHKDHIHWGFTCSSAANLTYGTIVATLGETLRTREFVEGLQSDPTRIDRLIAAGIIGEAIPGYWRGKLGNPDDPEWKNFVNAVEVETALRAGSAGGAAKTLNISLTGTAKPG